MIFLQVDIVSRYRVPQIQVGENYNSNENIFQANIFTHHFSFNLSC